LRFAVEPPAASTARATSSPHTPRTAHAPETPGTHKPRTCANSLVPAGRGSGRPPQASRLPDSAPPTRTAASSAVRSAPQVMAHAPPAAEQSVGERLTGPGPVVPRQERGPQSTAPAKLQSRLPNPRRRRNPLLGGAALPALRQSFPFQQRLQPPGRPILRQPAAQPPTPELDSALLEFPGLGCRHPAHSHPAHPEKLHLPLRKPPLSTAPQRSPQREPA